MQCFLKGNQLSESCLSLLFLRFCGGNDFFHIFFKLHTGQHDHVSAAAAFDTKINARPQDFPLVGATGMVFFHLHDIANRKLHGLSLLLLYNMQGALGEGNFDAFFVQPVFDAAAQLCFYGNICFYMTFCHDFYGDG